MISERQLVVFCHASCATRFRSRGDCRVNLRPIVRIGSRVPPASITRSALALLAGITFLFPRTPSAGAVSPASPGGVRLVRDAIDESAGGLAAFMIVTPNATYFLEKTGAGLSSLVDRDGHDWIGFHPQTGSAAGGAFRGFPNAVHKQDGSYFHPMNDGTDPAETNVEAERPDYVSIVARSSRGHWECRYEFFPTHCTFTMTRIPSGLKYWVLYEGTPGGALQPDSDYMVLADGTKRLLSESWTGDLQGPEWLYFADGQIDRALFLVNHTEDDAVDSYYPMGKAPRNMTVFGFGRSKVEKFIADVPRSFSIGLVDSWDYPTVARAVAAAQQSVRARNAPAVHPHGDEARAGRRPLDRWTHIAVDTQRGKWGDFDGDGDIDLRGSFEKRGGHMSWWKNPGDDPGDWQEIGIGRIPGQVADRFAVGDLNGDTWLDIVVSGAEGTRGGVYWHQMPHLWRNRRNQGLQTLLGQGLAGQRIGAAEMGSLRRRRGRCLSIRIAADDAPHGPHDCMTVAGGFGRHSRALA